MRPPRRLGAALLVLLFGVAAVLGACRPREIVPNQPSLLVQPDRELVTYRRLTLPNAMRVMLVSNPRAERSAASLAVRVGSLDDPPERPGLTHFLEHMLFLGTEKYPKPNGYTSYLSSHAGGSNAYTADDHTNYFFSVAHDGFPEALDRFAQFFVAPLFNQDYTDREMNAVDAEHAKNVENDFWRTRQVQRLVFNPEHPISRFSTGNLETLRGTSRAELLRFYRGHYSANLMTLAVVGNQSLDALEALVRERFAAVKNRGLEAPTYPAEYLAPQQGLRVLRVEPVTDQRLLTLHFPLPSLHAHDAAKPLRVIGAILGHEGEGSLLSLLKAEGLATSLSAGGGEQTEDYAAFEITVGLTDAGLERFHDVARLALGAVRGLERAGVPRHLYEEYGRMAALEYRFREVPAAGSHARHLSALMQRYPLEDLPEAPFLFRRYDPALYRRVLGLLTADNLLLTLVAKGQGAERIDRSERWYGARYGYEVLRGAPYAALAGAQPDPRWRVPAANPFIPERVALREPDGPLKLAGISLRRYAEEGLPPRLLERLEPLRGVTFTGAAAFLQELEGRLTPDERREWLPLLLKDAQPLPVRLLDTRLARVWYLPDWRFRQPKAELVLKFYVEGAYGTPRGAMLASLYEAVLEEGLNEYGYPIKEAGLGYGIRDVKGGIVLSLSGYSARMLELLSFLVSRLGEVHVDPATFAAVKERLARDLENQRLSQPYLQSRYYASMLLRSPNFTREARLAALEPLTLEDVQAYAGKLLRRTYVEGVVVGNMAPGTARAALHDVLTGLKAQVLPAPLRVEESVRALPAGADWTYAEKLPVANSLAYFIYQAGEQTPRLEGALRIIARPLREGFYHELRTQQQLGYIVWGGMGRMRRTLQLSFLVQSGQYPADVLTRRIQAYLPQFVERFRALSDAEFERYREAVRQSLLSRPDDLSGVARGLYWAAFRNDERFDAISEELAAVERLSRAEVEAVLTRVLADPERRRLLIRLTGREHRAGPVPGRAVSLPPAVHAKAG